MKERSAYTAGVKMAHSQLPLGQSLRMTITRCRTFAVQFFYFALDLAADINARTAKCEVLFLRFQPEKYATNGQAKCRTRIIGVPRKRHDQSSQDAVATTTFFGRGENAMKALAHLVIGFAVISSQPDQAANDPPTKSIRKLRLAQSRCGIGWRTCTEACGIEFNACQVGKTHEQNVRICVPRHSACVNSCRRQHCH